MKIKFDSDDDWALNRIPKFRILTIIIRDIFEKMVNITQEFI